MLSIVLICLKIVGIILLVIVGLLILLLLAILFVPIRYRLKASKQEEDMNARVKVTWLLHLISFQGTYQEDLTYSLKIGGFTIFNEKSEEAPEKNKKVKQKKPKKQKNSKNQENLKSQKESKNQKNSNSQKEKKSNLQKNNTNSVSSNNEDKRTVTKSINLKADQEAIPENGQVKSEQNSSDPDKTNSKNSFFEKLSAIWKKIRGFFSKLLSIFKNIKFKFETIYDKLKKVGDEISYYRDLLESEQASSALKLLKKNIFRVLKSIRPRKLQIQLEIGTGDPASTGEILAVAGMLYPIYGQHIRIIPYFDQQILNGRIFLKGRVMLAVLIYSAAKIYFSNNMKTFIRLLKKEDE